MHTDPYSTEQSQPRFALEEGHRWPAACLNLASMQDLQVLEIHIVLEERTATSIFHG